MPEESEIRIFLRIIKLKAINYTIYITETKYTVIYRCIPI